MPEVFGSSDTFHSLFNLEDENSVAEKERMIRQLHQVLTPFMLRRLKADVERSLPVRSFHLSHTKPKIETILYVGMSAMQKELYKKVLVNDFDTVVQGGEVKCSW